MLVNRVCFYHAGCPDGFGAAWAVWRAWGDAGRYVPRRHEHRIRAGEYAGDWVAFVDIAPTNEELGPLAEVAERLTIVDHHITARDHYLSDLQLVNAVEDAGHEIVFDMDHSGAVLAWHHFADGKPVPDLLRYVEDQDLWNWTLPQSEEINAAITTYPRRFDTWSELADRDISELAREGESVVRANRMEIERRVQSAHPVQIDGVPFEAVNATTVRSALGHALAQRRAFGVEQACVYRVAGDRVYATLYSIGDVDVAAIAVRYGGGGHRNAAGFTVRLTQWEKDFVKVSPQPERET